MSGLPDYIPAKAPAQIVTDLSGVLNASQLASLNKLSGSFSYKPRVIVMRTSYQAQDSEALHTLTRQIATAWHVEKDRMLMVIDLSGHKVHTIAGGDLTSHGVTNDYIKRTVLSNYFYPYIRKGDVAGAIQNTLTAVNARQIAFAHSDLTSNSAQAPAPKINQPYSGQNQPPAVPQTPPTSDSSGMLWFGAMFVVGAALVFFIMNKSRQDKTRRLTKALTERLGTLYTSANDLGQASEYLPPVENKALALSVSAFFEKLGTLDKAKEEIEKLTAAKRFGKANEGLLPALKLADNLNEEGAKLLEQVNAVTGGVDSNKEAKAQLAAAAAKSADGQEKEHKVQINVPDADAQQSLPYARPAWTFQPDYNQPLYPGYGGFGMGYGGGGGGMFDALFMINQMQNESRLERLEDRQNYGNFNNSNNSSNSSNNNYSTDSGGSWTSDNSSSSFGTDTGGSWDSGSSDSGSSDFGSSDSGSSDSGGSW